MRFSVWPSPSQPVEDLLAVARHADATGWDGVYVSDHFMGDGGGFGPVDAPVLESTALLAAMATATRSVRLGSLVFGTTYRHPAVLANWAATVDRICGGRLVLGIGAGWQANEHEQYGIELPAVAERVDRFAEVAELTRSLLSQPTTTFAGDWFTLTEARCEPKPVQSPLPLLIGAKGDRMLAVVARFADEWNMWALPEALPERMAVVEAACERIGRDPATIARSNQALVLLTDDEAAGARFVDAVAPRAAIAGTPAQVADAAARYREVGVHELIVPDFVLGSGTQKLDALDALLEAVTPLR